jgi:hypothetical protein
MPKSTKKKPRSKAVAAALKAMENLSFETADLDFQLKQLTESLKAIDTIANLGSIWYAGGTIDGSHSVAVVIGSTSYWSTWPDWAYEIAKDALHFNRQVLLMYQNQPTGLNLLWVYCSNRPV